jgi:hypothetical protein
LAPSVLTPPRPPSGINYALVARGTTILVDHTLASGNFAQVAYRHPLPIPLIPYSTAFGTNIQY